MSRIAYLTKNLRESKDLMEGDIIPNMSYIEIEYILFSFLFLNFIDAILFKDYYYFLCISYLFFIKKSVWVIKRRNYPGFKIFPRLHSLKY